jgi:hypothetical protein
VDVMDSLYPGWSFYLEDKKMSKKVSKTFKIVLLIVFIILVSITFIYG